MISAGGFVAVSVFGNRSSTEDIDYILDPELKDLPKAEKKLSIAIEEAAEYFSFAEAIGIRILLVCIARNSEIGLRSFLNPYTATTRRLLTIDEICRL